MQHSNGNSSQQQTHRRLSEFLSDFPWIHLGIGLCGNLLFVVGSVMFFYDSMKTLALWLFTGGSSGMLIGSIGQLFVKIEERRKKKK